MQVSVEATGNLERRLTVAVPADQIDSEIEGRLRSLTKTARVDGFRRGKVPLNIVKKMYGPQVRQEVIGDVMQRSFYEAITREKLQPAGVPRIQPKTVEPGKTLEYTAVFEVYPEVKLAPLAGMVIDKPVAEVTGQDIDHMLEKIRKQRTTWVKVERAAGQGDRVIVDFTGTIHGEPFEGNEARQYPVERGAGRLIKGFEEHLTGVKAGDETTLKLEFPENYHNRKLAGQPVSFAVKVHQVEEARLPDVDEDFIRGLGVADGTVDTLRAELRKSMQGELDQALQTRIKKQVSDKLLELNAIEIPKALIDQEIEALRKQLSQNSTFTGQDEFLREQARRRVTLGLIFSEIIKINNLNVPQERLRAQVEKIAGNYDDPEEILAWYYGDRKRLAEVEAVVLEDIIAEWALSQMKVNEAPTTFDALVQR